jgi:hypothetical protein
MVENSICHYSLLKKTEYFKTTQIAELCPTIRGIVSSIFKESPQYQIIRITSAFVLSCSKQKELQEYQKNFRKIVNFTLIITRNHGGLNHMHIL